MNLNLEHLKPRQRLAAVESQTTLEERQGLDLLDRQRLAIAVAGRHLALIGVMYYPDPLDLARRAIEADEQPEPAADVPPRCAEQDLRSEWHFRNRRRGG
ncbi:MAG: hypothetical protein ACYSVY_00325 [Planctomycetota bacterium]|jgi:hypothetical protein